MTLRRWQSGFLLIVYFYLLSGQLSFRNLKRLRFGMCLSKPLRSTFRWTGINRVPVFANMWEQNTETGCNGKDILMSSIFIAKIINNNTKKQQTSKIAQVFDELSWWHQYSRILQKARVTRCLDMTHNHSFYTKSWGGCTVRAVTIPGLVNSTNVKVRVNR